jgi:cell division protein FtsI/penicillin-binding protein 2
MMKLGALKARALSIFIGLSVIGISYRWVVSSYSSVTPPDKPIVTKEQLAKTLGSSVGGIHFPSEIEMDLGGKEAIKTRVEYTFDPQLQKVMENLFQSYGPDYGAFVAMDATTGKVLSMVSYSRAKKLQENLALRASFPSASVFKVVTAAAAIEGHKVSANTVIPFNGRSHTLYRGQIFKSNITRWTRFTTLKDAFAHSINTVFGKIGAYTVGPDGMRFYADRFGFNRKISADLPMQEGTAHIPDDVWGIAESASGFTRENKMSPLQGALIAASVANDGKMMEPYVVNSLKGLDGTHYYTVEPKLATITMDPATASEVRSLMKETVLSGTSRGAFRGFFRKDFSTLDVGGKTGSLTGMDPKGKYDWFVGYAHTGQKKIAFASLTIHEKKWRVKSSYLARRAIETYFKDPSRSLGTVVKR